MATFWFIHLFISFITDLFVFWILAFKLLRTGYFKKTMIAISLSILSIVNLERFAILTCGFMDNHCNKNDAITAAVIFKMGAQSVCMVTVIALLSMSLQWKESQIESIVVICVVGVMLC